MRIEGGPYATVLHNCPVSIRTLVNERFLPVNCRYPMLKGLYIEGTPAATNEIEIDTNANTGNVTKRVKRKDLR